MKKEFFGFYDMRIKHIFLFIHIERKTEKLLFDPENLIFTIELFIPRYN